MAIKIGITGGIGSGKSVVSRLLEIMGIPVYISDIESRRITGTDPIIRMQLCELLGDEVFAGGVLNKPLLASYLFAAPEHAAQVNAIIHPRVKDDFRSWQQRHVSFPVVGMESAILIESGFAGEVDVVVIVYAPLALRLERTIRRDSSSREMVMQRIQNQMDDEEKRKMADFIVVNDDETPLIPQVLELISFLSKNIDYLCQRKNY